MNAILALALSTALSTALSSETAQASGSKKPTPPTPLPEAPVNPSPKKTPAESFASELLVSFKTPAAAARRGELFARFKLKEIEKVGSTDLYLVEVPAGSDPKSLIKKLSGAEGVKYAEPNQRLHTMSVGTAPNDDDDVPTVPAAKPGHSSHDVKVRK